MDKLLSSVYYIIQNFPGKLDRKNLSRLLYYSDGVYFQRHSQMITNEKYIRLEDSPELINLNLAIIHLIRILNKVLKAFKNGVRDEDKNYPNLYENYVITPIYGEIVFSEKTINTKIHIFKKKSLLSLSGKIFRVLFET